MPSTERIQTCLETYTGLLGRKVTKSSPLTLKTARKRLYFSDFKEQLVHFNGTVVISGLIINRPSADYVGLFAYTSNGAIIKNLSLVANIRGKDYVGGFVGSGPSNVSSSYITISNCTLTGDISGTNYVGGFCGRDGTLSDSRSFANVHATGNYVGGLIGIGHYSSNITNCIVSDVTIEGCDYVGGLVGEANGDIQECGFIGTIIGKTTMGGCAGSTNSVSRVMKSFAIGNIFSTGHEVGGLVGKCNCHCLYSYFSGIVSGKAKVGGLIGIMNNNYGVTQCYSNATVTGEKQVSGLIGYIQSLWYFNKCIYAGRFVSATCGEVGRIYGDKKEGSGGSIGEMGTSDENKAYNRAIVIKNGVVQEITDDQQNGTGVSATTLKLKATYVAMGWDFTDTWTIQETECFPYFKTQTAPPVITSQLVSGATVISGKCVDGGTIMLEIDGERQQVVSSGNSFSFTVSPLQAGHEVRISAKAEGKEQSYYTTELVSFLGKGTEADPYQVYTASDLTCVYRKGYYKLMNDIDLTDYINRYCGNEGWESVGREGSETIYFDGDGHKVTGLWCSSTRDNTGLFSCFANGYIKNLTVETTSGKQVKGGSCTGIIIGKLINGEMIDCKAIGSVSDGTPVGGMIGKLDGGKLIRCQANVTINTTGEQSYVGGLAGEVTGGEIDQCVTLGTLKSTGTESYVGGLVGKNSATVTNCYSNAAITSSYNAAGIIAYNYGIVEKCYATGNLYSNNYAAGIIGYNDGASAVISNCVAMNNKIDVRYESQAGQGGGYGQRIIGGIKNNAPAPELNNYALKTMQVSVNNVPQKVYDDIMNGVAKTGPDLLNKSTYQELGWDFSDVWSINESENYPSLKHNVADVLKPDEEPVTVTAKSYTREYGEPNPTFEYTSSGATLIGVPAISCEATATSPVGTYPIVIKKGSVTNENDSYVNGTLTITKAPLTIRADTYVKKQGEENPEFTLTYEGFKNNETPSVLTTQPIVTTSAVRESAVGEYEVKVSGAEAENYVISYVNGKLIVMAADAIVIIANSYTREYGDANPTFGFISSGAALNGTPQITCEATATSPVGIYPIVIKKGSVTNYNDSYVNGTLTITKAPLTIKAGEYTKEQGKENPEFTLTYEGFKNNETSAVLTTQPRVTTTAVKESPVGDYEVIVSGAEAKNYEISYVNGTLTIVIPVGIGEIDAERYRNAVIYNLSGQRLSKPQRGVNIIDGKKVIVR